MALIFDTTSPTCTGHTEEEVKALTDHVCRIYKMFYAAQLATLNASLPPGEHIDVIDDDDELTLDQLDHYDFGLKYRSWTLPGYPLLGAGAYRVALGLCPEHALKINPGETNHNSREAEIWFSVPDKLLPLFVPVVAVAPGSDPLWLIAFRAEPLALTAENDKMAEQIGHMLGSVEDLHAANLGRLHGSLVLLDYGHTNTDFKALLGEFKHERYPVELIDDATSFLL